MTKQERAEREILKVIENNPEIKRIAHIFNYYPKLTSSTFYLWGLEKSESIKKALEQNRLKKCASMLDEMCDSDNPTLKLAGYKLICSDEDREKLATSVKATATISQVEIGSQEYEG